MSCGQQTKKKYGFVFCVLPNSQPFFTCCYAGLGERRAVALAVPCQYGHSVVPPTLQRPQLTGSGHGMAGVCVSVGLGQGCVIICPGAGPPRHRHHASGAVQVSGHGCRVTRCWRRERRGGDSSSKRGTGFISNQRI